jgi:hypothetical protein
MNRLFLLKTLVYCRQSLLKHRTLKIYPGLPHGLLTTHAEISNPDPLAFVRC